MLNTSTRHWMVAFGLGAIALVTGASAASVVSHARHTNAVSTPALPFVSGDLGEVIVHPVADLGEVIVRAPADLGDVLVEARRFNATDGYLAQVVVSAPRFVRSNVEPESASTAALVAAQ